MPDGQKLGRPTEFTREIGHKICVRVAALGFEAVAAEGVGVHRHTVRHWRERGEKGEAPFVDFARELASAKAAYMERELENVDDAKWKLERLDRQQFSPPQKHELTGKDGAPMQHAHKVTHSLSRDQSLEIVTKILGVPRELVEGKFGGPAAQLAEGAGEEDDDVE